MSSESPESESESVDFVYYCVDQQQQQECAVDCVGVRECDACACVVQPGPGMGGGPGGAFVDVLLCLSPIALLIYVTMKRHNPWPTTVSLPVAAGLLALIRLAYFGSDPLLVASAIVRGWHEACTPLSIMAGAIGLFETMEATNCLPYMMREMKALTDGNAVAEAMLLFAFAYTVEGASGFGTPVALAAPMLVSSGHAAVESVVVLLLFNTFATPWGAVGTPLWFGLGTTLNLTSDELLSVSRKAAVALAVACFMWMPWILTLLVPASVVRRNLGFICLALLVTVGPSAGIAMVNYEFPALIGGLVGTTLTAVLIKYKVLLVAAGEPGRSDALASSAATAAAEADVSVLNGSNNNDKIDATEWPASPVKLASCTVGEVQHTNGTGGELGFTGDDDDDDDDDNAPVVNISMKETQHFDPEEQADGVDAERIQQPTLSKLESFADVLVMDDDGTGRLDLPLEEELPRNPGKGYVLELLMRTFPIWGVVLLLMLTRMEVVGIKPYLIKSEPSFSIHLGTYGVFRLSVSAVFQLDNILTYPGSNWKYELLYVPFLIPFVLISAWTMFIYRKEMSCRPRDVVTTVLGRLTNAAIALAGAMSLVQLMIRTGDDAPAEILGNTLANWFEQGFVVISPLLGALGSFFSGSTTVSNLTFGNIQAIAAQSIGTSTTTMLALQACGGSAGNGICLNNIIAGCAVVGLNVGEGEILRKTYKFVLLSTTTSTVVMLVFFFRFNV